MDFILTPDRTFSFPISLQVPLFWGVDLYLDGPDFSPGGPGWKFIRAWGAFFFQVCCPLAVRVSHLDTHRA